MGPCFQQCLGCFPAENTLGDPGPLLEAPLLVVALRLSLPYPHPWKYFKSFVVIVTYEVETGWWRCQPRPGTLDTLPQARLGFPEVGRAAPWQLRKWQLSSPINTKQAPRFTNDVQRSTTSLQERDSKYHPHFPGFQGGGQSLEIESGLPTAARQLEPGLLPEHRLLAPRPILFPFQLTASAESPQLWL